MLSVFRQHTVWCFVVSAVEELYGPVITGPLKMEAGFFTKTLAPTYEISWYSNPPARLRFRHFGLVLSLQTVWYSVVGGYVTDSLLYSFTNYH